MQGLRNPEELSEVEIRQEARFVLWALRCCALLHNGNNRAAQGEIVRGFEIADALETLGSFREFGVFLQEAAKGVVWHGPACGCISSGEMHVLHALSQVADHQRDAAVTPSQWWRVLVPAVHLDRIEILARRWLADLGRAGIEYPGVNRLIEALTPLHMLMDETPGHRPAMN